MRLGTRPDRLPARPGPVVPLAQSHAVRESRVGRGAPATGWAGAAPLWARERPDQPGKHGGELRALGLGDQILDATCPKGPQQIARALSQADPPVLRGRTLYIATGARAHILQPFTSQFDVRTQPQAELGHRPSPMRTIPLRLCPYSEALIDRHVCMHAERFFGHDDSTFSRKIDVLRNASGRRDAYGRTSVLYYGLCVP